MMSWIHDDDALFAACLAAIAIICGIAIMA